jgi:predicted 3-demethylubiquinone-9 3-methyltransferase (glyoxalase superfamily)
MPKIVPFLWFDTQALEAAKFYVSVFKGPKSKILNVSRYGESGPGKKGSVMVVDFLIDGQRVQALNGGQYYSLSPAFSFSISCKTQKEIDGYWKKLLAGGGKESQCGWLTDKFGLSWQVVPEKMEKLIATKDAAKAQRVMAAMMKMVKLDIAALEAAAKAAPAKRKAA